MSSIWRKWLLVVALNVWLVHDVSAQQVDEWQVSSFRIHGSNTVGEKFAPLLIEGFLKSQGYTLIDIEPTGEPVERQVVARDQERKTRIEVELQAHGSSTGFKDLLAGTTDIAMSSRKIKDEEIDMLLARYPSMAQLETVEHIIAYDALAIMVHPENPVSSISLQQLAAIFSGEVTNWKALGGYDSAIEVLARDNNSGTFDTFKSLVLKPFSASLSIEAARFESSRELANRVSENVNAIGFVGISHTKGNKVLAIAKEQGAKGIVPDKFTIGTEDYPLSRKLFLYLPTENAKSLIKEFVEFATHEEGQRLAPHADLISFYPTTSRPSYKQHQLSRQYANLVMFGKRLSVMLRLNDGKLDAKARRDLERVIQYRKQNPHNRLVLAGFWDDPKFAKQSEQQLQVWVDTIKQELNKYEIEPWQVEGGFLPIENNDIDSGRAINRRVEVWVL